MRDLVPLAPPVEPCDVLGSSPVGAAGCAVADGLGELGSDAVAAAGRSAFDSLALSAAEAGAEMFTKALSWWVTSPSVIDPNSPAVQSLQDYSRPVVLLILMISVLAQAIRMIISRKKDPAVDVVVGLVRFAVISMLGLVVLVAAVAAADGIARSIMDPAVQEFTARMDGVNDSLAEKAQSFILFFYGLGIFVLSIVQWILGFFRQAGILVLATMIPLAASGSVNRSTRPWMSKLTGWLIALVAYKPMAAMIYAIGLQLMGEADDLATAITGVMVLILAVLALPAMLRFFQWTGVSSGGGGGAAGVLAAGATGAIALHQIAGGSSANRQADTMNRSGPQTAPAGAAPAPSTTVAPAATGAAPQAGAGGAAAGSAAGPAAAAAAAGIAVSGAVRRAPGAAADKMTGEG
jgi:type IV secretion system protein TrbL